MGWIDKEKNVDLSKLCTIKIGGKAKTIYLPQTVDEVKNLLIESAGGDKQFIPIGTGSNTVFSDGILDHIFVSTKKLKKYKIREKNGYFYIDAQAGVNFKTILFLVKKYNLEGFEYLSGIPASIGGAVVMNAGAFGSQISDIIHQVEWIDEKGEIHLLSREEINFGYRKSPFQKKGFVFSAVIKLKKSKKNISFFIKKHLEDRNKRQPLDKPTSGSTFKNPPQKSAGYLLEKVGLKGYRVGNVSFSDKHANFLINLGGGRYRELKELVELAEKRVGEFYQIKLEKEIKIVE